MPQVQIADNKVSNVWKCMADDCNNEAKTIIHPDWYQLNGTPMCSECNTEMDYEKTLIDIPSYLE